MRRSNRLLAALCVAGLVAAGGSAFTATSGIDSTQKFVGATGQTVSGVHVNNVQYTVGTGDVTTAVDFDVDEVLGVDDTVTATISDGAATPVTRTASCGHSTASHLLCTFAPGVTNATSLKIVAS